MWCVWLMLTAVRIVNQRRLTLNDVVLMDISGVCVFVNRVTQTTAG